MAEKPERASSRIVPRYRNDNSRIVQPSRELGMMTKRNSLFRAIARPLSMLLFWQSLGWIAFGILEPWISQKTGTQSNAGVVLIVSVVMTAMTAALGAVALYLWKSTDQKEFQPKLKSHHKCRNCGHPISIGTPTCPHCGANTLFYQPILGNLNRRIPQKPIFLST